MSGSEEQLAGRGTGGTGRRHSPALHRVKAGRSEGAVEAGGPVRRLEQKLGVPAGDGSSRGKGKTVRLERGFLLFHFLNFSAAGEESFNIQQGCLGPGAQTGVT